MPPEPAESGIAVEAENVSKTFGTGETAFRALDDVSLRIRSNEFFTLLGPSGCGKTTLLRCIAGFEHPTSGRILLDGKDISGLPPYRRPVNTVFQNYALFPHLTVAGNVAFGLEMLGKPRAEIAATVDKMLALVQMTPMRDRLTAQISGGQQQRVALARALAAAPRVLLLDEPLSALDYKLRKEMQIELKRLQHETGITFVFVTHDQEEALTMSDRIAVMSSGKVLQVGPPREIYDRPSVRFVADFIGETNFLEGAVADTTDGALRVALDAGGHVAAPLPATRPEGRVTLAVRPEHATLVRDGGEIRGTLETVVYAGTDTQFHVRLPGGGRFVVRRQNSRGQAEDFAAGDPVGIRLDADAAQILRD